MNLTGNEISWHIREHNKIHQRKEPLNSPIITEILEVAAVLFEKIDAGDYQVVKHGHWIDTDSRLSPEITYNRRGHYYICSVCGRIINVDVGAGKTLKDFPYCHCGAKMDGGEGQ